jgi:hypothetical protein
VFATPTWVSGALRMPQNAFATIVSTCVATLGAYGIGTAVLRQLPARRGKIAVAVVPPSGARRHANALAGVRRLEGGGQRLFSSLALAAGRISANESPISAALAFWGDRPGEESSAPR